MSGIPADRPGRCAAEVKRRRIAELKDAVAAGESPIAAVKRLAPTWGITSRRNASRYVTACIESWERDRHLNSRAALDVALARREHLYRRALALDDLAAANRALDALDDLNQVAASDGSGREFERMGADLLNALRLEVTDRDLLLRILRHLRVVVEEDGRPADRVRPN